MSALPLRSGTGAAVPHGLPTATRNRHLVAAIRGTGSDTAAPNDQAGSKPAPLPARRPSGAGTPERPADVAVVVRHRRPRRAPRDGAVRVGAIVPLDAQGRAAVGKPAAALGWTNTTALVLVVEDDRVVVREGKRTEPRLVTVRLDAQVRLTLSPTVIGALRLAPGAQVVVVATPVTGELSVHAAADVLQDLTGVLAAAAAPAGSGAPHAAPTGRRRSSFAAAFRPE